VIYQGIFSESYLKIKENIISTAPIFGRIGVGLQTKDRNPTSNPTLNPTPNPTLGVIAITGLTIETAESNVKVTQKQCKKDTKVHFSEELFILLEGNLLKPGNPYCGLSTDRRPAAEELKYSRDRAQRC
jgi:hypothetical protein